MKLTPKDVAKLKPKATSYDVWDALRTGLGVHVFPSGKKSWTVRYRVGRRQRRMTLDSTSVLSLAEARKRAKDELKKVSDGHDPQEQKRTAREADTVGEFAREYIDLVKDKKRSWRVDQSHLKTLVLPTWKHRLLKDVTRRDVRDLIDGIAKRGPILANRVRALLHKMFNVAIQRDLVSVNPVTGTARPGVEQSRNRVLSDAEIQQFWKACGDSPVGRAFKLRLITAQRGGEVFSMRWQDVDLEAGWWTIPGDVTKNKLPHRVPLSEPARKILTALKGQSDDYVFAGYRAKREQGPVYDQIALPDFRGHDLRRTAATRMTSTGTARLVVGKILNHVERGVTSVYDRATYDAEKQIALDAWARTLTAIINSTPTAVLPFQKKRKRA